MLQALAQFHGEIAFLAAAGVVAGLVLFVRGLQAYRSGVQVSGIGTSAISAAAAGEIRVTGHVRPGAVTLVSPVQSRRCVYYRASISEDVGEHRSQLMRDERAVGFQVEDATGSMRVFPGGARWELPQTYGARTGVMGDEPAGLALNTGATTVFSLEDRETAIQDLLTVHRPDPDGTLVPGVDLIVGGGSGVGIGRSRRTYEETVLEPDAVVTVVGTAIPFRDLPDPSGADAVAGPLAALDDPEVAADLAAAATSGQLAAGPEAAWGNAAIPGFGIGRPVRAPVLDPDATPEPVSEPAAAKRAGELFDIPPDELVLAARPGAPLTVYAGTPGDAEGRAQSQFLVGVVGAALAIACAVVLALVLTP